jgi:hypothetical protein
MKNLLKFITILLLIAGLNNLSTAQPQYYNQNTYTGGNSWPLNSANGKDAQLLYLPGAFGTPSVAPSGSIIGFSMLANNTSGPTTYTTLTIQMGQSNITTLPTGAFYTGTMTTVYSHATVTLSGTAGQWLNFTLDTPFPYNNTLSLIVDMGQCGASAGGTIACDFSTTGFNRNYSGTGVGCPFVYYGEDALNYCAGITLTTNGPPVCVTTAATAVTGISATLNGTVNANGLSATVTFNYGLTTAYGTTVPGVPSPVSGSTATAVSAAIAGLANNTTYHCQVVGVNSAGTTYGNDITFTTLGPPPTVVTTAATGIGLTTATVNGTVNANNNSTAVTFNYGLTTTYGSTVAGVPTPVTGNTVTPVSAALAGLVGNTTYHYRVVGVSVTGTSNGNDMTFTTAGPPVVVTNPATNIGQTTAQLNGTVTGNYLSTAVSFNWGLTTTYGNVAPGTPTPVTGNTATAVLANISGLTNLATYHFQCVGVNAGGTTLGADQSFQTGCTPPGAPGAISGPANVCQGTCGYIYSISPIPNATSYSWTVPVGGTITAGQGTTSITVCYSIGALYGFVAVAGIGSCGNGPAGSLTINVYSPPLPTITGPASVCIGSTSNIYVTQYGFSNYTWAATGGTITSGQGTYSATITWNTSGAQTISVNFNNSNGCSAPAPTVYNVTVNALPVPTISGLNNLCVNSGTYAYTTQSGFSNYTWSVSSGGTINSGQNASIVNVTWNASGSQNVSVNYTNTNGCSALSPTVYPVTVNPLPGNAGTITGTAAVCAGASNITYSVAPVTNAIAYIWTLPQGASNVNGATSNTILVDYAANASSGNITVYGNDICGNGTVSPIFAVTVNPIPPAPVVTNTGTMLSSSAVTGNQWYDQAGIITGATGQTYVATADGYYWDMVTLNGCSSDTSNHKHILTTGINQHSSAVINLYPVPNEGMFNVSITTGSEESFSISVYNTLGVKIYEEAKVIVNGSLQKMIDLRPVPNGVYTVIFEDSMNQVVKKIVVSK